MSTVLTPMTEHEFGKIFVRLAAQLRWSDYDADTTRDYFAALKTCSLEAIDASAASFATEPGRRFFPTTGEWSERANKAATAQVREALTLGRVEPWQVECDACEDSGWERFECTGDSFCGRQRRHAAHTFVRPCACRESNRTYQRHQRFGSGE
jgi:hypothetical protein